MATHIGHIGEFNETAGAEDFESYVERMDQCQCHGMGGVKFFAFGEERKADTLLSMVGANAYRLLKECGLTTLETRRLRGDQIEVFKILNGYENIDRNIFFSLKKDSRTRGHEVKLVKDQCRLDIRKHSFSQRTINEWNKLSTDCVTASSVNMFKNKVDTYLRRAGYK